MNQKKKKKNQVPHLFPRSEVGFKAPGSEKGEGRHFHRDGHMSPVTLVTLSPSRSYASGLSLIGEATFSS